MLDFRQIKCRPRWRRLKRSKLWHPAYRCQLVNSGQGLLIFGGAGNFQTQRESRKGEGWGKKPPASSAVSEAEYRPVTP